MSRMTSRAAHWVLGILFGLGAVLSAIRLVGLIRTGDASTLRVIVVALAGIGFVSLTLREIRAARRTPTDDREPVRP
jgi:hypothetical protein